MPQTTYDTLVATTVKSETLTGNPSKICVINRGSVELFFTTNGTDPTVAGDNTFCVLPSGFLEAAMEGGGNVVKLISSGTPTYGIEVIG